MICLNDIAALRMLLHYDPETGVLRWEWRPRSLFKSDRSWKIWNTRYAGKEAFTAIVEERPGAFYRRGRLAGKTLYAHRIAWALHTGSWPTGEIDHEDGDGLNNRFINFRDATHRQNGQNTKLPIVNTTGAIGVYWNKKNGNWNAKIKICGKSKHIGCFADFYLAVAARQEAESRYGFHKNHGRVAS